MLVPNPLDPSNYYTNQTRVYDPANNKNMYFEFDEYLPKYIPTAADRDLFLKTQWEYSPCNIRYSIIMYDVMKN